MKKSALIILFIFTIPFLCQSQDHNRKGVFGVNAGCSVPFADFRSISNTAYAGYAGPGINIDFDLLGYTRRYFGISVNIGYASLFFREKPYQAEYERIFQGYGQNSVSAGNYQIIKGMAGIIFKIPETHHTEILLLLQLGSAISVHPNLTVTNSELGIINSIKRNPDWHIASSTGFKINYWLNDRYGLSLNYTLNLTRPEFHDETSIEKHFFLNVRYMNINAGFIMKLKTIH